jgi:alkylation response protein AidB-like acyl-CoA dehydrogenase
MDFRLSDEQEGFRKLFRSVVEKEVAPQAAAHDAAEEVPRALLGRLAEQGFLAAAIPEEHGGAALDAISYALLLEALGEGCLSTAVLVAMHNSLVAAPLLAAGTPEQHQAWLPALAAGEALGAFALSEPETGSDATRLETRARADGDAVLLDGVKSWVTNAAHADVFLVFAASDPARGREGVSAYLVPRDTPGLSLGPREPTLGLRGIGMHHLYLEGCRLPAASRLGPEHGALALAGRALDHMRLGLAAAGLGAAETALALGRQFAVERKQFGVSIATKQAIGNYFADTRLEIESLRHLVYHTAWLADSGAHFGREAAMAKLLGAQVARNAANRMLQVHGGYGFSDEYPISRVYRDVRALAIMGGTDQIQRVRIAADEFAGTGVELRP